jgi:hypothetical protein
MRSPLDKAPNNPFLGRIREANPQFAVVEDGVVGSHENITQDPAMQVAQSYDQGSSIDRPESWSGA